MSNPLQAVQSGNAAQGLVTKRFETGRVVSVAGGVVTLDVGYYQPDGSSEYLELPHASNFTPEVNQMVGIIHPNDNPNSAYVIATSEMAQYDPIEADPTYVFTITISARINADHSSLYKIAEWINQTGKTLTVLGVSFTLAQSSSPADNADARKNGTSILSSAVTLDTRGEAVAGTLSGTPTIAADDLVQLYVSSDYSNHSYCMILTVSAPL